MSRRKLLTIVGARPQFVKAAPLSRALARRDIDEVIVHTGQHFDLEMSNIFFDELAIPPPRYHLGIHSGQHGDMTGRMLQALEPTITAERPDIVVVYGDTNSTLAGALCAAKLHIQIAHVEAGLRSYDRRMPEEINRVITDHLSNLLFCPTRTAINNLRSEGITHGVHFVGDVMFDAVLHLAAEAKRHSTILNRLLLEPGRYAVATVHRAENTDDPKMLAAIIDWLTARAAECPVIFPLHPRTQQALARNGIVPSHLRVIEPLGYLDMTQLVRGAQAVYTDSGGLQKEAYFHRVPCVTLRCSTEWVETIEAGWNRLWHVSNYETPRTEINDYGDGTAAEHIAKFITEI